jgi:hypothetical protein
MNGITTYSQPSNIRKGRGEMVATASVAAAATRITWYWFAMARLSTGYFSSKELYEPACGVF